ncbi:TPA: endonuclease III [Candidatus Peregrinibacteria bacterium]|nr:MAG: Endonuclease III [Candidatus Peregrinibacteria bacterium GW2011_GWA2_43_8]HAU40246.1 endonuclease III [Candidatus Peregrinibacteria bacterium]
MDRESILKIVKIFSRLYPHPTPTLKWTSPFECLIAVILSAQCTDKKVNLVTRKLFGKANTPGKILILGQKKLAGIIKPCGLFNGKSRNIIATCEILIKNFNGKIPQTQPELETLPGVGPKTAQVILAQIWNKPAFPVDTHIHRVANRLGICTTKTPEQTEKCLKSKIPSRYWHDLHLQMIFHGRETCKARRPSCHDCPLANLCDSKNNNFQ